MCGGFIHHEATKVVAAWASVSPFEDLAGLEVVVVEVWGDKDQAGSQIEAFRMAMGFF